MTKCSIQRCPHDSVIDLEVESTQRIAGETFAVTQKLPLCLKHLTSHRAYLLRVGALVTPWSERA